MKPALVWLTQSSARIAIVILLALLVYFIADGYQKGRDLKRVCSLIGSHSAGSQDVGIDRRIIDAICLGQETDDDS